MKLFVCAILVALGASATTAWATCQSCPEGQTFSHIQGVCVPKTVSS